MSKPRPIEPREWQDATSEQRNQYATRMQTGPTEKPEGLFFFVCVLLCVVIWLIFVLLSRT